MSRLLACCAVIAFAVPSSAAPKKVALLVGVKEYEKNLAPLRFPEDDAVELGKVLKEAGYEVVVLCDALGDQDAALRPTRKNTLAKLEDFRAALKREDTFFVAFAGHGLQFEKDPHPYYCPIDADKKKKETLVDLDTVATTLEDSGAGVRLMVVDACRDDPTSAGGGRQHGPRRRAGRPCSVARRGSSRGSRRSSSTRCSSTSSSRR